jgi:hypothetical protein
MFELTILQCVPDVSSTNRKLSRKDSPSMRKHEIVSVIEKRPRVCQGETRGRGVRQKDKDGRDCYVDD